MAGKVAVGVPVGARSGVAVGIGVDALSGVAVGLAVGKSTMHDISASGAASKSKQMGSFISFGTKSSALIAGPRLNPASRSGVHGSGNHTGYSILHISPNWPSQRTPAFRRFWVKPPHISARPPLRRRRPVAERSQSDSINIGPRCHKFRVKTTARFLYRIGARDDPEHTRKQASSSVVIVEKVRVLPGLKTVFRVVSRSKPTRNVSKRDGYQYSHGQGCQDKTAEVHPGPACPTATGFRRG